MNNVIKAKEILEKASSCGISYRTICKHGGPNISTLSRIATGKTKKVRLETLLRIVKAINA